MGWCHEYKSWASEPQIILFLFMFRPQCWRRCWTPEHQALSHTLPHRGCLGHSALGNTSSKMGRMQKEKNMLKYQGPLLWPFLSLLLFPLTSVIIFTPCLFVCFPRAVGNSHVNTPSFNNHGKKTNDPSSLSVWAGPAWTGKTQAFCMCHFYIRIMQL